MYADSVEIAKADLLIGSNSLRRYEMKIYIAGKITGDPDYFDKFQEEQDELEALGHIVLNPAQLPEGMSKAEYMRICFAMIDCAEAVCLLSDWEQSEGAKLERQYCEYIGKRTFCF